jgi:tRNA (guanine37-N1)-methyltransferase
LQKNLREVLRGKLGEEKLKKVRAFDMVGDIAVIKLPDELLSKRHLIGKAVMEVHPSLRTVLLQTSPVKGEFRTREVQVIAGGPRTETSHRESGCEFKVDLARVYFSPRLAHERMRIATQVKQGEAVANLFAGVGCYSIIIAKRGNPSVVYSVDKNPVAFEYMRENIRINKVGDKVVPILGDAREVVKNQLAGKVDRVLMPLPELARDFFDTALAALKQEGGVVHFYDFGEEPDPFAKSSDFVRREGEKRGLKIEVLNKRKVRSYATRCYHVVLDVAVKK